MTQPPRGTPPGPRRVVGPALRRTRLGVAVLAWLGAAGCRSEDGPIDPGPVDQLTGFGPFQVSNVVAGGRPETAGGSGGPETVIFVSLPPGTMAQADRVEIRNLRSNTLVSGPVTDGGLDPLAVPAGPNDTLALTVKRAADSIAGYRFVAPPRRPPGIVRTDPRPNKRDVVINIRIGVVFTEPVDPASVGAGLFLESAAGAVTGRVQFANAERTVVEFVPDQPLAPGTDYRFRIGTEVRDDEGTPLEAEVTVPFATEPVPTGGEPPQNSGLVISGPAGSAVFVSIKAGTAFPSLAIQPDQVQILARRTGFGITRSLAGGGLDPVAVPAGVGDTLVVTLTNGATTLRVYELVAPAAQKPEVIRTDPAPDQLVENPAAPIRIVFSEPMDSASFAANLSLGSGGAPVPGRWGYGDSLHTVAEFQPDRPLDRAARYTLHIGPEVRDDDETPLGGGLTVAFTVAMVLDASSQLAFVRDGQIYLVNADGSGLVALTQTEPGITNSGPAWSPDGRRLAFSSNRDGEWRIYTMDADGSNVVRRTSGLWELDPAWSPDGQWIAHSGQRNGSQGIFAFEVDGSGQREIVNRPGYDAEPAWKPDGSGLSFTSDWRAYDFVFDLFSVRVDGSDIREVLVGPSFWDQGLKLYHQSAWSPDGSRVAVLVCAWNWIECVPDAEFPTRSYLALANADGSGLTPLIDVGGWARPSWSPDGSMLAFMRTAAGCLAPARPSRSDCEGTIETIRIADGRRSVVVKNGSAPAWRPQPR